MSISFEELKTLIGYKYRLWHYQVSHSELTIRAEHPGKPGHNVHLNFVEVYYIQVPAEWRGDFELGSDAEFREVISRAGLKGPFEIHKSALSLFKVNTPSCIVYILGSLISIKHDVEPIYNRTGG